MIRTLLIGALLGGVLLASDLDEALGGFEEMKTPEIETEGPKAPSPLRTKGLLALQAAYNTRGDRTGYDGLSRAKVKFDYEARYRFENRWQLFGTVSGFYDGAYAINGEENYTSNVVDEMEGELEVKEAYIQGPLGEAWDLKAGRQIVVWGKSSNLRVTDSLNPLDLREPGMTDIEDLRLAVGMVKLDYYAGPWNLSFIALPEVRTSKHPVFGSDFYPASTKQPEPEAGKRTQYAASLAGTFTGWDMALYLANRYRHDALQSKERITMAGLAANRALGNWLLKGELAALAGLQKGAMNYDRFDTLIGLEYQGFEDTTISLEALLRRADDAAIEDAYSYALRVSRKLLRERAELIFLSQQNGQSADAGGFTRLWGNYDLRDALSVQLGYVAYQGGQLPYEAWKNNDRLFGELRYSF